MPTELKVRLVSVADISEGFSNRTQPAPTGVAGRLDRVRTVIQSPTRPQGGIPAEPPGALDSNGLCWGRSHSNGHCTVEPPSHGDIPANPSEVCGFLAVLVKLSASRSGIGDVSFSWYFELLVPT